MKVSTATQVIAHNVSKEYSEGREFREAAKVIMKRFPDINIRTIRTMWCAIEAYVERMGQ